MTPSLFVFLVLFFFFNDTATTEIYTLSLHDALPISAARLVGYRQPEEIEERRHEVHRLRDRKSTRLNSSHRCISYAVFCLKKKNNNYDVTVVSFVSGAMAKAGQQFL